MHYSTRQTVTFALHAVAETLGIPKEEVVARYNEIECELLKRFYAFARDRREKNWVHWNMRNIVFGFEHLEHRYRTLTGEEPPSIPVEVRVNLNDALKERYGQDYAPDPRMKTGPSRKDFSAEPRKPKPLRIWSLFALIAQRFAK